MTRLRLAGLSLVLLALTACTHGLELENGQRPAQPITRISFLFSEGQSDIVLNAPPSVEQQAEATGPTPAAVSATPTATPSTSSPSAAVATPTPVTTARETPAQPSPTAAEATADPTPTAEPTPLPDVDVAAITADETAKSLVIPATEVDPGLETGDESSDPTGFLSEELMAQSALASFYVSGSSRQPSGGGRPVQLVQRLFVHANTQGAHRMFVESDVVTDGTVVRDTVRATLRLVARDPSATWGPGAPTAAVFAAIDRYRVRYVRSDGRNAPGIDVPHPWDGALTLLVSLDGKTGEFVLVRASAKLDPPLVRLRDGGGDLVINTLAYVTFYGRDHGGARIEATGAITVEFADWPDAAPLQ